MNALRRAILDEPDEEELRATREIYDNAAPALKAAIAALSRRDVWEASRTDLAEARWLAGEAMAALERVNARLDQYGWAA